MSRRGKSIYAKLKAAQAFEPQVCPIIVNGDSGAESLHVFSDRITSFRNKRTQLVS
jgi:hypothetical protein